MGAQTPTFGFPFESPDDLPGITLTGGPSGDKRILAEIVEDALLNSSAFAQGVLANLVADGNMPGQRIATSIETSDSATTDTTEIDVITVTAALVSGRTYRIRLFAGFQTSNPGDSIDVRIREGGTGVGGTLQQDIPQINTSSHKVLLETEYTAGSTGNQTFAGTLQRNSGSGDVSMDAAGIRPAYLYVDYIRG